MGDLSGLRHVHAALAPRAKKKVKGGGKWDFLPDYCSVPW